MTAPSTPGPDNEPTALSARERAILAGIETDLTEADPALAQNLASYAPTGMWGWPSIRKVGWLVPVLVVIIVSAALLPPSWWALLAVIIVVLVVPWMLLCAIERTGRPGRPPGDDSGADL